MFSLFSFVLGVFAGVCGTLIAVYVIREHF